MKPESDDQIYHIGKMRCPRASVMGPGTRSNIDGGQARDHADSRLGESSHTLALTVCWDLEEPANGQAERCAGAAARAEALRGVVESQQESV